MTAIETDREAQRKKRLGEIQIAGMSPHQSIYKYISLSTNKSWDLFEKTLFNKQLFGSTINSLNDPFEGRPRFVNDLTENRFEECCKYFDKSGSLCDARDRKKLGDRHQFALEIESKTRALCERIRIVSFCRRSDSPLLWSHYANSHQGACIHFTANAFRNSEYTKGAVLYERHRPVVPLSLPGSIIAASGNQYTDDRIALRRELFELLFYTKPLDWAYEEEVRFIYSTSQHKQIEFDESGLIEIIIGAKCKGDDEKRMCEMTDKSGMNVKLRKAYIDEDTFSVGIKELGG